MMGQLNLLRMMNDVEPLAAINTSFVLVQSLLLGGSSGQTSDPGVSERYLQHFRSPVINASSPLVAPHPAAADDDNNPPGPDWSSVGVSPAPDLLMPEWAYQLAAIYLVIISVLGVVMNVTVVLVILNDPQKTPLNWMILNLAFSDGAIAGFGAPMSTVAALQNGWQFGDEMCIAYAMIMSTAGIGSITTLSVLALWRCTLVVSCPAKRPAGFSAGSSPGASNSLPAAQAALLIAIIWTYTLAVTSPPLLGWGRYDREAAHISCSVNWETRVDNNGPYILYMFTMGLLVPLAVIVVSYASILRVVRKTGEMKRKTLISMTSHVSNNGAQHDNNNTKPNSATNNGTAAFQPHYQSDAAERRVTVMVACMIGAFLVAWTPYSVLSLIETFENRSSPSSPAESSHHEPPLPHLMKPVWFTISPAVATVPSLFAKTSAIFNPLIYGLLNTQFRSAWARFSYRFLPRRHQHHHHHYRHHRHRHHGADQQRGGLKGGRRGRTVDTEMPQTPTVIAMNDFGDRAPSSVVIFVTQQAGTELMALTPTQIMPDSNPTGDADDCPPSVHIVDELHSPRSISAKQCNNSLAYASASQASTSSQSSPSHSSVSSSPFTITTATHFAGINQHSPPPQPLGMTGDLSASVRAELIHPPPDFDGFDVPAEKVIAKDDDDDQQPISLVVVRYLADTVVRCRDNGVDCDPPVTELLVEPTSPGVQFTLNPVPHDEHVGENFIDQ